jgi:hypothetical protein
VPESGDASDSQAPQADPTTRIRLTAAVPKPEPKKPAPTARVVRIVAAPDPNDEAETLVHVPTMPTVNRSSQPSGAAASGQAPRAVPAQQPAKGWRLFSFFRKRPKESPPQSAVQPVGN